MFTPLFLVLLAIGSTDILFALDSIPAIFGITREAYIVFAANAFALLGLRALFFLVSGLLDRLVYLSTGLSLILAFIGAKLILHFGHLQSDDIPEIETVDEPGRDRRDPRDHDRREPAQVASRPRGPRPRRLDPRSLEAQGHHRRLTVVEHRGARRAGTRRRALQRAFGMTIQSPM